MCAERNKGTRNLSVSRPLKMVGATNVPRNTRSTILNAIGKGDGEAEINARIQEAEINARIQHGARASDSSVLLSRPGPKSPPQLLRDRPQPQQLQVGGGAIGRSA